MRPRKHSWHARLMHQEQNPHLSRRSRSRDEDMSWPVRQNRRCVFYPLQSLQLLTDLQGRSIRSSHERRSLQRPIIWTRPSTRPKSLIPHSWSRDSRSRSQQPRSRSDDDGFPNQTPRYIPAKSMRLSFWTEESRIFMSTVSFQSMRCTYGLWHLWVDDCEFAAFGA